MERSTYGRINLLVHLTAWLSGLLASSIVPARGADPPPPVYLGVPQQRARIDAFISELSQESLADSAANLTSSSGQYMWPGVVSGLANPQLDIMDILANRRSVKVLMEIADLPESERATQCQKMFDQYAETHLAAARRILKRAIDPQSPQNEQSMLATKLSLCAAMLATALHCEPDIVRLQLASLEEFRREVDDFATQHGGSLSPNLLAMLGRYINPDNRAQLNVLAMLAERTSNRNALDRIQAEGQNLRHQEVQVVAWNAHTNSFDIVHRMEGIPLDTSKGSTTYRIYDWKIDLLHKYDWQRDLIYALRGDLFPDR